MDAGEDDQPKQEDDPDHQFGKSSREKQSGGNNNSSSSASQAAGARSYECIFCKRGFSNAQALGGHMNIHRKDKAKLKHQPPSSSASSIPSSANTYEPALPHQSFLDIHIPRMMVTPVISPQPPPLLPQLLDSKLVASSETSGGIPWSWNFSVGPEGGEKKGSTKKVDNDDRSHGGGVQQLPLFSEIPSKKDDLLNQGLNIPQVPGQVDQQIVVDSSHSSSSNSASKPLDLELRLGPERDHREPRGTKKFF